MLIASCYKMAAGIPGIISTEHRKQKIETKAGHPFQTKILLFQKRMEKLSGKPYPIGLYDTLAYGYF